MGIRYLVVSGFGLFPESPAVATTTVLESPVLLFFGSHMSCMLWEDRYRTLLSEGARELLGSGLNLCEGFNAYLVNTLPWWLRKVEGSVDYVS